MDRRELLALSLGLAAGLMLPAGAETIKADGILSTDPAETVVLWSGTPPGGKKVRLKNRITERSTNLAAFHDRYMDQIGKPDLVVFRPASPNGAAVLIAPGGGYIRVVLDKEGYETARFLNALGVTCFVLRYRLPGEGWAKDGAAGRADVPLQDVQRAMRLIRASAAQYGIDPARLGVMGFSAGGHVAASLATRFDATVYEPRDDADKHDAKPAFAALVYPVITMGAGCHEGSRVALLGEKPTPESIATYSYEKRVRDDMMPGFITLALDDAAVPPQANGAAMFRALQEANIPAEMHAFEIGGHGFGLRLAAGKPCAVWADLFVRWAQSHGFIPGV
ncbi:MAG: alpha/beta hydrolase [Rhizomicrobium sp.]